MQLAVALKTESAKISGAPAAEDSLGRCPVMAAAPSQGAMVAIVRMRYAGSGCGVLVHGWPVGRPEPPEHRKFL